MIMEKMQKGGGGARAKRIPGMGSTRTKKNLRGAVGEAFKSRGRGKSKLSGVRSDSAFGKKKYQYGGNPADMKQYKDYEAKAKGMGMMDPQDQRFYARQQMRANPRPPAPAPAPAPKMQKGGYIKGTPEQKKNIKKLDPNKPFEPMDKITPLKPKDKMKKGVSAVNSKVKKYAAMAVGSPAKMMGSIKKLSGSAKRAIMKKNPNAKKLK